MADRRQRLRYFIKGPIKAGRVTYFIFVCEKS